MGKRPSLDWRTSLWNAGAGLSDFFPISHCPVVTSPIHVIGPFRFRSCAKSKKREHHNGQAVFVYGYIRVGGRYQTNERGSPRTYLVGPCKKSKSGIRCVDVDEWKTENAGRRKAHDVDKDTSCCTRAYVFSCACKTYKL